MELLSIEGNGKTSAASARRKINIDFVKNLPLEGLSYGESERMILFYTTPSGEKIFLQYPGKESIRENNKHVRDFRPKVFNNSGEGKDLTFGNIWAAFFDLLKRFSIEDKDFLKAIDYLILLFYKSAYLVDFIKLDNPLKLYVCERKAEYFSQFKLNAFDSPVYIFDIKSHRRIIDFLQNEIGDVCGMSIEAFLLYNDLLGWNEDYKYYEEAVFKGKEWNNGVGKPNTLLTHISILGYIRGELNMSDILMRFVRSRGISAPLNKEIQKIFDDYINKQILLEEAGL